jgi:hypothetical protein
MTRAEEYLVAVLNDMSPEDIQYFTGLSVAKCVEIHAFVTEVLKTHLMSLDDTRANAMSRGFETLYGFKPKIDRVVDAVALRKIQQKFLTYLEHL